MRHHLPSFGDAVKVLGIGRSEIFTKLVITQTIFMSQHRLPYFLDLKLTGTDRKNGRQSFFLYWLKLGWIKIMIMEALKTYCS